MPQFTNWEWQGEGDYYSLVGIDPMGEGLNKYSVIAEIRMDEDEYYAGWVLLPHFDLMTRGNDQTDPFWIKLDRLQREIVYTLVSNKIIKEKPIDN